MISWQKKLRKDFSRGAALGIMIDYQEKYFYSTSTSHAFHGGKRLTDGLKKAGIRCIWTAHATHEDTPFQKDTIDLASKITLADFDRFKIVLPEDTDIVVTKTDMSILQNARLRSRLHALEQPSIVVGGVFADQCVASSVADILNEYNADIVIALDATNEKRGSYMFEFCNTIANATRDENYTNSGRLHIASVSEILDALKPNDLER
jgi:nicotinamidase-related amidase